MEQSSIKKTLTPQSLTTVKQARMNLLEPLLSSYNRWREDIGLQPMGHAQFVMKEYGVILSDWLKLPLTPKERLQFYQLKSKYNNFKTRL